MASGGLGVDLLELKKAGRFYKDHSDHLPFFLSRSEIRAIRKSRRPEEEFALFVAAKEAVFKALGFPWMGRSGFSDVRISRRGRQLSFRLGGGFAGGRGAARLSLGFFKNKKVVLVECR